MTDDHAHRRRTVVLDDDPTGTQSASAVRVLLRWDTDLLRDALADATAVYVQTNSRALSEADAVELARGIRDSVLTAASRLGVPVRFVLRGDSTLRGHVVAETEVFLAAGDVMVFVPAFPEGGRTTRDGIHRVRIGDEDRPAHLTEFAEDPVFPFRSSRLVEYLAEKTGRPAVAVDLATVRDPAALDAALAAAPAGSIVAPDAVSDDDIRALADAVRRAEASGRRLVVRSAAPLASELAGVASAGLLQAPVESPGRVLLVCGSHTGGATAQLDAVLAGRPGPVVIDTAAALADPVAAGEAAAVVARVLLDRDGFAALTSERARSGEHGTLDHGARVMAALMTATRALLPDVDTVISKGGITSAETTRTGLGADEALVLGQILPGVSAWRLRAVDGRDRLVAIVPGNVGDASTLVDVLAWFGDPATDCEPGDPRLHAERTR